MKIEYVTSSLGIGTELHISAAEYKRVNSEAGFNDHANMLFAVKAYAIANESNKNISKQRFRGSVPPHQKKWNDCVSDKNGWNGKWCELYAVTEGDIIPVITSNDGSEFTIDFSNKTIREKNRIRKEE